jgi:histidine triad (HIT) family protein
MSCVFCQIVAREKDGGVLLDEAGCFAFLDHRPLFPGHALLVPRAHYETLAALPAELIEPFFAQARRLAIAVEAATGAEGTFIAMNNKVSQSVPHLHVHVVPRRKGDGLRGFFWPRQKYASAAEMEEFGERIRKALGR